MIDAALVEEGEEDNPRKKAWVDARTYEWDVHYLYPMADEGRGGAGADAERLFHRDAQGGA